MAVPWIANRPSLSVFVCASCLGAPALAAHRVTVDWAMGAPPPSTWPLMSAAKAHAAKDKVETRTAASIGLRIADLEFIRSPCPRIRVVNLLNPWMGSFGFQSIS